LCRLDFWKNDGGFEKVIASIKGGQDFSTQIIFRFKLVFSR
jgi:hypothetical protein